MKLFFYTLFSVILLSSCNQSADPFSVNKQNIGLLTDSTSVKELETIYASDSIVKQSVNGLTKRINVFNIYDAEGNKLLELIPVSLNDEDSKISSVQFFDKRYKTDKGVSIASTFKTIKDNYTINNIENTLNSVVLFVNELNATISIDKKELPENIRHNNLMDIEAVHIPDEAPIKYFFIHWN